MNDPFENISKALDVDFVSDKKDDKKLLAKDLKRTKEEVLNNDFDSARLNMKELINNGMDALDGIMKVATASDSPRAYEVAALILRTVADMNKDLMVLHEKSENIQKEKVTNITNNSIYVGSTTDLQNLINSSRAQNKELPSGE